MENLDKKYSPWTKHEEKQLVKMYRKKTPVKDMVHKLGRSRSAIHLRLKILGEKWKKTPLQRCHRKTYQRKYIKNMEEIKWKKY